MRILLAFSFIINFQLGFTQITIEKTNHNFGNLYANMPTYSDFTFKNTGQSKVFLLANNKPREVYYLQSSKFVLPDSSVIIRLKINDNIKGRFNYKTEVFFSNNNKPFIITLTGNVKERNNNPLMACPDFNSTRTINKLTTFEITVKVIDSLTNEPIRRSKVYFVNNGDMVATYYTNSDGIIHESVPLGLYYITAHKNNYLSNFYDGYLNFKTNYVEIKLQKPTVEQIPNEIVSIEPYPVEIQEITAESDVIVINEHIPDKAFIEESKTTNAGTIFLEPELQDTGFTSSLYAPNNLVFVVDVSSSMNQRGKFDLLKKSMIELAKILRPQDRVSLLAYSGSVNILFELKKGTDKEKIIEKINELKTGGYTNGDEAIKEGIRISKKGYIEGGNNLVFLVTDGAFNKGSKSYMRYIESANKTKGIKFSVVGIKTGEYLNHHLTTIANNGGGAYIRIITLEDAKNKLFKEVKRTSLKKN